LNHVVNDVGANKSLNANGSYISNSDSLDSEWISNVKAEIYAEGLATSQYGVPNFQSVSRPSDFDTDRDGMPDEWEMMMGYNPDLDDSRGDHDDDGYSNIEEFLNLVDIN